MKTPRFPLLFTIAALWSATPGPAQPAIHLTLDQARQLAIRNNPRLGVAKFTAAAAYQVPLEYRSAYQPTLNGSFTSVGADNGSRLASGGLNNPIVYDRVGSGLSVAQMITDFGRTGNLVGAAKLRAQAQDQVTEATRADILLAVSRAYFSLLRSRAVLKVAEQTIAARRLIADQATALAEAKLKSTLDVSFANVNLSEAKLLYVQAQNDAAAAEADLATAMGTPGPTGFVLAEEPLPQPLPDRFADLLRQALQDRPELKDLRLEETAQQRFAKAEHALQFPTIGILGTTGFVPTGSVAVPGRYGAIGVNVNVPIFNGGLFKARQTEAEMRAQAAGENVSDLQNRIGRDLRVAWLNASTAYDRLGLTRELLDQARLSLDLARSRYDLGLSSIVELSQAELNYTSAEIAGATAKYDYQAQRAAVDYQLGALR
jgi:outer membrane protein